MQTVGDRLKLLQAHVGARTQGEFAEFLGVEEKRLGNILRDAYPLGSKLAFTIKREIPGVTLDWLWHGDTGGMSSEFLRKLMEVTPCQSKR